MKSEELLNSIQSSNLDKEAISELTKSVVQLDSVKDAVLRWQINHDKSYDYLKLIEGILDV